MYSKVWGHGPNKILASGRLMPLETSLATEQWLRPCPAFLAQKRPLVSHPSCEGMSLEA